MEYIIYRLTKDILEESPFASFEADDKAMTFTCNQFDHPIVLAIVDAIDDDVVVDPLTTFHYIEAGESRIQSVFYDGYTSKKRYKYTRYFPKDEKIGACERNKYEVLTEIINLLHTFLNGIRHNFFGESICCSISHACHTKDLDITFHCDEYSTDHSFKIYLDYWRISPTFKSKKKYSPDYFHEVDIFKFCRENKHNPEIFK